MATAKTTGRSPSNGRPPSRGRQKIKIEFIENKAARQVTFTKRKTGIFKKASEIALLCGARVAAILFSNSGKPFAFGSPSVGAVLRRFAAWLPGGEPHLEDDDEEMDPAAVAATLRQAEEAAAIVQAEQGCLAAIGKKVLQAVEPEGFWWQANVNELGEADLPAFHAALLKLRGEVKCYADKRCAAAAPTPLPVQ